MRPSRKFLRVENENEVLGGKLRVENESSEGKTEIEIENETLLRMRII